MDRDDYERSLDNKSMEAAQKSFMAQNSDYSYTGSGPQSGYSNSANDPENGYGRAYQQAPYQNQGYRPGQYQQPPYQAASQPQPVPRKRHHVGKWLAWIAVAAIVVICFFVYIGSGSGGNDQANNRPQTVKKTTTINNNRPDDSKAQAVAAKAQNDENNLKAQMRQIQLDQQEQQTLMDQYMKLSNQHQIELYNKIEKYKSIIPTDAGKRFAVKHYINGINK